MKLSHDAETDMLYIDFEDRPSLESFELCDGIVVDLDADEHVVGIDVEWASQKLDIERLRAVLESSGSPGGTRPRRQRAPRPPGKPSTIQKKGIG